MKLILHKDKVTKNTVRYTETETDDHPIAIYLTKERVEELDNPETIAVTIEKES